MARPRKNKADDTIDSTYEMDPSSVMYDPSRDEVEFFDEPNDAIMNGDFDGQEPEPIPPMTQDEIEALMVPRANADDVRVRRSPQDREAMMTRRISSQQQDVLLKDGMDRILKQNPVDGIIPSLIRYDTDGTGSNVYSIYDIDGRVMKQAYDYYFANAENPTVRGLLDIIDGYSRPRRTFKRLVLFNWTTQKRVR